MSTIEQVYADAARRWQAAMPSIERTRALGPAAEPIERKEAYLKHQLETGNGAALWAGARAPDLFGAFGTERVLATNDLLSFDTLQKAIAIGRFVGQVCRRETVAGLDARLIPLATGSMVSPRLFLTNHHVLGSAQEAAEAVVRFDYQLGEEGDPLPTSVFAFEPAAFFVTDELLDYTLVALAPTAQEGTPLAHFGWNRLNPQQGKILRGYPVNIIQHPEGDYKQIVLSNNKVLDLVDHYFLYEADTLPGSSGAPVFNRQWEVVALHRRGVPCVIDGAIVTRGGRAWTRGIPESEIRWIGNEGTRVSSLLHHLARAPLAGRQDLLRRELTDLPAPQPFLVARQARAGAGIAPRPQRDRQVAPDRREAPSLTVDIALRLTVSVGPVTIDPGAR
ncbi:trypsin-like serine peptidase [Massilia jejuensis]|uniref:Trypsin-like serine peptidase n=1 Tax=Massilia jejuensis TaxID=648894 RepID=A0ABW0PGD2_9BURK